MEIATIQRPLPKPFWVKSDQSRTVTSFSVFLFNINTAPTKKKKKAVTNKPVSQGFAPTSSLFLYTVSLDYICQVFVTGEALADTGSFATSLLLSPLLCHPVLLACRGSQPSCNESSAVTAKAVSFPKRLLFTPSAVLQTNKPSHSFHYPNKVILNPHAEICLLTGLRRSTCHCQSLVLRMRIMKV